METLQTSWTAKLLERPLVEIRRGFSLGYAAPTEKSAVIALTAPSGKFVDIRVPKETAMNNGHSNSVMPSAFDLGESVYATSGILTSVVPSSSGAFACPEASACMAHSTWAHHIDSSGSPGTDGADMLLLANGEVLEVGVFDRGDGSGAQMFKELWINEDVDGLPYIVVETTDSNKSDDAKGMIVRIGPYCQGVLQTKSQFWLERWRFSHQWTRDPCSTSGRRIGSNGSTAGASKKAQVTDEPIPCLWACEDSIRVLGDQIEIDGREWRVTEVGP